MRGGRSAALALPAGSAIVSIAAAAQAATARVVRPMCVSPRTEVRAGCAGLRT
ncbi:hypothetical protein GCM10010214_18880 [Streptomyces abikoensis]|nr:hypothetical protein GCM10010214_18880 [Streptomyces abikoensis]